MTTPPFHRLVSGMAAGVLAILMTRGSDAAPEPSVHSEHFDTARPWTRWWWPGSAVDKASLTGQLEKLAAAGIGGVEITPIYGARGYEERYIDFLSPQYMDMLEHVGREARRLGLGVDMATGTGWPFGGPWISEKDALQKIVLKEGALSGEPTRMMVKRAAPGGQGFVINPYSVEALEHYLEPFSKAFEGFPDGIVRGQFHDSFEYYDASWAPAFPEVFQEMHGYDIRDNAAELMGGVEVDRDVLARLKDDFRSTLARMHLDYLREWVRWSHEHGFIVRNQSHGAPANLLDLYANADIAETETFGSTPFPIPGLRREAANVRHGQDLPEPLVIRFASSAAHVAGHPLASSETCTWLREHWKVSLAMAKPEIDRLFANGINHIFYHGTVFSPQDAPWPGWLFYASTQFNPQNTWWRDFAALNTYVTRVQTVLQSGRPDNGVLLYWPVHDIWDQPEKLMIQLGVHDTDWAVETPFGDIAATLDQRGYAFDYISDAQVQQLTSGQGKLIAPGGEYQVIIVPETRRMPVETMRRLVELAEAGATVYFETLPQDVPGLGRLESRRAEFAKLIARVSELSAGGGTVYIARGAFASADVQREPLAEAGLDIIRRAVDGGHAYFVTNLTGATFDGWAVLGAEEPHVLFTDPLTGRSGLADTRASETGTSCYMQLAPGESLLIHTTAKPGRAKPWQYTFPGGGPLVLEGEWSVEFIEGGPELPASFETAELKSWTDLGGPKTEAFGGTARYRLEFELRNPRDFDILDLGDVRESARVKLNGHDVGTVWSLPMRARVGEFLRRGRNTLELEVTNLAANRIRDLDRRGVDWKIMHEINFVNIRYRPFDASEWPAQPSGLLGPVRLLPARHAMTVE